MKDQFMRHAAAILLGGFIAVQIKQEVRIWILAFFVLLLIRVFYWKPADFWGRMNKPEIFLLSAAILIGFFYGMTAERIIAGPLIIQETVLQGKIEDWSIDHTVAKGIILLQNDKQIHKGLGERYSIRVYTDSRGTFGQGWEVVKPGDRIRFAGRLEQPKGPGTAGEFDVPLYNAVRGLSGLVTAKSEVTVLEKGEPGISWRIREKVGSVLKANWPDQAGIMQGILFGDSSRIPSQSLEMYKASGVMHVFAASGSNVAFVILLFWGIFFFLPQKLRIAATVGMVVLYAALCQGNPPILRASILGIAVLIGRIGKGKMSSLRWLMFAALSLFVMKPLYLKDISFLLSFAATWGMIVLSPRLEKVKGINKLPGPLRFSVAVSLSAQIAALPILIEVFHKISLVGFIANIFILFILGAVLQFGLIGTVLIMFPFFPCVFFQAGVWLLYFTDTVLGWLAAFPFSYYWVLSPGQLFWLLWYCSLGVWLFGKDKVWFILRVQLRKLSGPLKPIFFLLFFILLVWISSSKTNGISVTFLDVGQGDCVLIRTAQENLLVDTGPKNDRYDAGERIIVPYLMEKRINELDMVFITHEDSDHIGGAKYLFANIPVKTVGVPEVGDRLGNPGWQEGIPPEFLDNKDKLMRLQAGDTLEFSSGLTIEILAPVSATGGSTADPNNNSLVMILHYLGSEILLTGDMEKEEMQQISDRGAKWNADFIKVPHHGGKGSLEPSWYDETYPLAVIISVGRNSFGHPSPEVLAYWQERNVTIFRTDIQGTIELENEGQGFRIIAGRNPDPD
ncbi:MAG: DNA internalization-related competence protein ComEC/Rec2 [Peptococcaceae bacterium]|nr:DNA internalization-related competence protein ComEC/Rec2 [Peptococcaceae bacterium]